MNKQWTLVLVCGLSTVMGWHSVWAQTQPRLFLTPEQRQMIEQGRQGKPSTPATVDKTGPMETAPISVSPESDTAVGLEAVIVTPKGQRLARINGRFENITARAGRSETVPSAPLAMQVEQGVMLRVGERYQPKTGDIVSMHQSEVPQWAQTQHAQGAMTGESSPAQIHSLLPQTLAPRSKQSDTEVSVDAD